MSRRARLECRWESDMERRFDLMPPWWWSSAERRRRRDAWVAERLATSDGTPDQPQSPQKEGETP